MILIEKVDVFFIFHTFSNIHTKMLKIMPKGVASNLAFNIINQMDINRQIYTIIQTKRNNKINILGYK